jgi:hypothetical protein
MKDDCRMCLASKRCDNSDCLGPEWAASLCISQCQEYRENTTRYYVTYKNMGRSEKTQPFDTYDEAKESASFLKFQKATSVKIHTSTGWVQK